ncbi:MAG TPA: D-2-hydroxyacid dehydrogenase [Vicinamibacterales bacterium]|nr:D-2-hydroxyacid dehydrogenase [Vicinamibacterales bacterium]
MTKKIVVLDGYTLNPGDLTWAGFEAVAPIEVHDRTDPSTIVERAGDAEFLLTNKTPLSAEKLRALPDLRYIGVLATGYNVVDVKAARAQGVTVSNIPTYGTASVAQHVFALLLELSNHVMTHAEAVRQGQWTTSKDWCFTLTPLVELAHKTLGIVGFGRIGRQVGDIGHALGMRVIAFDSVQTNPPAFPGFRFVPLDELLQQSDVVSLHCPLFPETQGLINATTLRQMKPTAFLINTSRGPLVVEQDLADALNEGRLAGAGLDVLSVEPPPANPLLRATNCLVTPHVAWASREARTRLMQLAVENLTAFANGRPQNVVGA